jgi:hypothetical protein
MSVVRNHAAAVLLNTGSVLITGGSADAKAELYDPGTGTWADTGTMSVARWRPTATLLDDGRVLVAGGDGNVGATAELYDPVTGLWAPTGSMTVLRGGHTATLLKTGKVLVAGGTNLNITEVYDPTTGQWTTTGSMAVARSCCHTATSLPSGRVLITGGEKMDDVCSGPLDVYVPALGDAEEYDPATGSWGFQTLMSQQRSNHIAGLASDGLVIVGGGFAGSTQVLDYYDGSVYCAITYNNNRTEAYTPAP